MNILIPLNILQDKKLTSLEKIICAFILMQKNKCRLNNKEISDFVFASYGSVKQSLVRLEKKHIVFKDGHKFDRTLSVILENIS